MTHISFSSANFVAWYLEFLLTLFLIVEIEVNQLQGDHPQPAAWQVKFRAMTDIVISEYIHDDNRKYCVIRFKCDRAPLSCLVGDTREVGEEGEEGEEAVKTVETVEVEEGEVADVEVLPDLEYLDFRIQSSVLTRKVL